MNVNGRLHDPFDQALKSYDNNNNHTKSAREHPSIHNIASVTRRKGVTRREFLLSKCSHSGYERLVTQAILYELTSTILMRLPHSSLPSNFLTALLRSRLE